MSGLSYVLALVMIIGVVIVWLNIRKTAAASDDGAPMPREKKLILILYLLLVGTGLVYMLASLSTLDFPETPIAAREVAVTGPTPPPAAANTPSGATTPVTTTTTPANPAPSILRIFPQSTVGSETPGVALSVYGSNFKLDSKVRFNAEPIPTEFLSGDLLKAPIPQDKLVGKGSITVDVANADGAVSNALTVPIEKPKVPLPVFLFSPPLVTREIQLLLLIIFAGALGSYLHAIMSLADFIAARQLTASWFWWYISRPFLGMAMALVFYAVLRGGFLAGTPSDAKVVNPFGVIAIGALVGMFSDKSAQKLAEVFSVIFKSDDNRSDKIGAVPIINKLDPDQAAAGTVVDTPVKIIGERLARVTKVRVNDADRAPDPPVSQEQLSFKLKPEDLKDPGQLRISVTTTDGTRSEEMLFTITAATTDSGLTIVQDQKQNPLAAAKVGVAYSQQMKATGGAPPYVWSMTGNPAWLTMDAGGNLTGTPAAADVGNVNITVTVKDAQNASQSRDLMFTVAAA